MFSPTHTIESVAQELIDGLAQGTVILRREESPQFHFCRFWRCRAKSGLFSWVLWNQGLKDQQIRG